LNKKSQSDLAGFKIDNRSRDEFLKSSFRYSGVGAILFIVALGVIVFRGLNLSHFQAISLFILAGLGVAYEFLWFVLAKLKKPNCKKCSTRFDVFLNSDRPNDTEYFYVCPSCATYFAVLHSEESDW